MCRTVSERLKLLFISGASALFIVAAAAPAQAETSCEGQVTVERGDTLAKIARRCDMGLSTLLKANPQLDNPNIVEPGTAINMPDRMIVAAQQHGTIEADEGDTLVSIADRLQLPLAYLVAANPDVDPHEVEPGMKVAMPASQ